MRTMNILYKIKGPSIELRYSLRSIEKYGEHIDKIFICSPVSISFLNNNVHQIIYPKFYKEKDKDILDGINKIACKYNLGENFWLASDDHFYLKPFDFNKEIHFQKGELPEFIITDENYKWNKVLYVTRQILSQNSSKHFYNCSQHCHTLLNTEFIRENQDIIEYALNQTHAGVEVTSLLTNLLDVEYTYRKDCKLTAENSEEEINEAFKNNFCISTTDEAFFKKPGDLLYQMFPEKSIFENDCQMWLRREQY